MVKVNDESSVSSSMMNIVKLTQSVVGTLLLFFSMSACAVDEIRTAAQQSSAPKFMALSRDGQLAIGGICVDIMRAIEHIDPGVRFVGDQSWLPRPRLEAGMLAGSIDVICGSARSTDRLAKFDFIDPPIFSVNYVLAVRADDPVMVANWEDIRKLGDDGIILAIHGFGIVERLHQVGGLQVDDGAYSSRSNLGKLLLRRGRFYCHRSPGMKAEIHDAGLTDKIRVLPTVMLKENFFMVTSKKMNPDTAKKLRAALVTLSQTGVLEALFQKYLD
ncbi:ABC-type amino acid transport substrate-binding protein [Oxalobacteraceae bacterium GrIS 2.11]